MTSSGLFWSKSASRKKDREKDRDRERERERDRERDRDRDREKDKDKEKDKDRERDGQREKDRERKERERERDRDKGRYERELEKYVGDELVFESVCEYFGEDTKERYEFELLYNVHPPLSPSLPPPTRGSADELGSESHVPHEWRVEDCMSACLYGSSQCCWRQTRHRHSRTGLSSPLSSSPSPLLFPFIFAGG